MARGSVIGLAALLLIAGCGPPGPLADDRPAGTATTPAGLPSPSAWPLPASPPPDCDDTSSCVAGFVVAGIFYATSCTPLRDEWVTETVLATGYEEVYVLAGLDPGTLVAWRGVAEECVETGDLEREVWYLASALDWEHPREVECLIADHQPPPDLDCPAPGTPWPSFAPAESDG